MVNDLTITFVSYLNWLADLQVKEAGFLFSQLTDFSENLSLYSFAGSTYSAC